MPLSNKKPFRLIIIIGCICLYLGLGLCNVRERVHFGSADFFSTIELVFRFVLFYLSALVYLVIGSVVWLYARNRSMSLFIFPHSIVTMIVLICLPSWSTNYTCRLIVDTGTIVSISLCLLIAIKFSAINAPSSCGLVLVKNRLFLIVSLSVFFILTVISFICEAMGANAQNPFSPLRIIYSLLCYVFVLVVIINTYTKLGPGRKKSQLSIFIYSIVVGVLPCILPSAIFPFFDLPLETFNTQYLALTAVEFPIVLGYSLLRYELLIFDRYVRKVIDFVISGLCLATVTYMEILVVSAINAHTFSLSSVIVGLVSLAMLAPLVWRGAMVMTERILFPEAVRYNSLVSNASLIKDEVQDLDAVASLIMGAAVHIFDVSQVCLLILDGTSACYQLRPVFSDIERNVQRIALFTALQRLIEPSACDNTYWLDIHLPALRRFSALRRPVLLRDILFSKDEFPRGWDRLMKTVVPLGVKGSLLAPLQARGQIIGILVLGERADDQPYAGADLELAQLLGGRFSSLLENARLYASSINHAVLLDRVYMMGAKPSSTFKSIDAVATTYAVAAADVIEAFVEIWLYDEKEKVLVRNAHSGSGPRLQLGDRFSLTRESDWCAFFFNSQEPASWESEKLPSCLAQLDAAPLFSLAWLPLEKSQRRIGVLTLAYGRPHRFIPSEMRILQLFASQGSATFEDAYVAGELRTAYERQKELDALKDQFIMIASHELRTPLTAVQGYIELLIEHKEMLTQETQIDFLEKARVGCNELTLMVGNMMDVNLVQADKTKMYIDHICLHDTIMHVLDILVSSIQRENHCVCAQVDPKIIVLADEMRLRQVLLNLINNALKYSSPGTSIEITARENEQQVHISIRDHGLGVPPVLQEKLFQRFMRLERDVNSSVRGTGLGLYICDQLVRAMGGSIHVESSGIPGEGSTFTFILCSASSDQKAEIDSIQHSTS
jgi:signal transduction histidine kinase